MLDVLKERALVTETFEGGRKLFSAEDPNRLRLAEDERRRTLEGLLPDLQALYRGGSRRPRVRVYVGPEGMEAVDEELLAVKSGEYFYFGGVREMIQNSSEEHLSDYYRKRLERGIWSNAIRIRGEEDDLDYMQNGHAASSTTAMNKNKITPLRIRTPRRRTGSCGKDQPRH